MCWGYVLTSPCLSVASLVSSVNGYAFSNLKPPRLRPKANHGWWIEDETIWTASPLLFLPRKKQKGDRKLELQLPRGTELHCEAGGGQGQAACHVSSNHVRLVRAQRGVWSVRRRRCADSLRGKAAALSPAARAHSIGRRRRPATRGCALLAPAMASCRVRLVVGRSESPDQERAAASRWSILGFVVGYTSNGIVALFFLIWAARCFIRDRGTIGIKFPSEHGHVTLMAIKETNYLNEWQLRK
jgi:hypothetical protein